MDKYICVIGRENLENHANKKFLDISYKCVVYADGKISFLDNDDYDDYFDSTIYVQLLKYRQTTEPIICEVFLLNPDLSELY